MHAVLATSPPLVASIIRGELIELPCGGADTDDFFAAQYDSVPPHFDAVGPDAELITMTIGDDDGGVGVPGSAAMSCGGQR